MVGMLCNSVSCTIVRMLGPGQGGRAEPATSKLAAGAVVIVSGETERLVASVLNCKIGDGAVYFGVGLSA